MEERRKKASETRKPGLGPALEALRGRAHSLIAAIAAHAEARLAYEAALDALADARARAVREGVGDRTELLERTRREEEKVRSARAVLRVAEANLEMARVAWETEKELLKALASAPGGGSGEEGG